MNLPNLWSTDHGRLHHDRLRAEARFLSRGHRPPVSLEEWRGMAAQLREALSHKLFLLDETRSPLEIEFHREIMADGYRIVPVSYDSRPGIRVTGTLYVPDGKGPFPAILNTHGHHSSGKIYPRFQARGHVLAQNGFVVLTVDAPGSGERGDMEHCFEYHGAMRAAGLFLAGDSMLGWQVRDNRRALDLLQSLPFVDGERLGSTGASGGGNQSMWLSALDPRIKAAVPVVSVGSFEAYVGRRNCVCETLPGGLLLAEEWGVLGLIAPRPLLIVNSIHDQPAFGVPAMSFTCRNVQEIYELFRARQAFDTRLIDLPHGYWPPMLEAMLGWMRHWLQGSGTATPAVLPDWNRTLERELLCYDPGSRPAGCAYAHNKAVLLEAAESNHASTKKGGRGALARLTGWKRPEDAPSLTFKEPGTAGIRRGVVFSPREMPLPVIVSDAPGGKTPGELRLVLSPKGKNSPFVARLWCGGASGSATASFDFPGTGELAWETDEVHGASLHDTSRAALWLGYSLAVEWAEAISTVARALVREYPAVSLCIVAEREAILAALLALALDPGLKVSLEEFDDPASLREVYAWKDGSLAWIVPGLLEWGDLDTLRALARAAAPLERTQP